MTWRTWPTYYRSSLMMYITFSTMNYESGQRLKNLCLGWTHQGLDLTIRGAYLFLPELCFTKQFFQHVLTNQELKAWPGMNNLLTEFWLPAMTDLLVWKSK